MPDPRILASYTDALGAERSSPQWAVDHVDALLSEARTGGDDGGYVDVIRARAGEPAPPGLRGRTLSLEDGGELRIDDRVPSDLPFGYHRIEDGPVLVLHAPTQVPSAGARPGWVVAAQLYAARSSDSWGHGDLRDARRISEWIEQGGAGGHLMLNPLHAPIPGPHPQPSPYFASSRIFRNPTYLCVDDVAATLDAAVDLSEWSEPAQALNAERYVDRGEAWPLKRAALGRLWQEARAEPATVARVDRYLADGVNRDYAAFCAVAEAEGGTPPTVTRAELRRTGDPTAEPTDDERFQAWLQLLLEDQLHGAGPALIHDVAVGTDRNGADTWLWPDAYVLDGTRVGAPPDQFNTLGQDWGLPPFHPEGLRAAGYEPFVRAVRSALSGAAGIRIDHILGLERMFWIPEQGSPPDGVYVHYPLDEMLDVIAIESNRADAFVVGEDLGTVSPAIREAMGGRGMLSYIVLSLDSNHPSTYPERAMAAITTHDLPTTIGLLTGRDLQDQRDLEMAPNEDDTLAAVARLREWVGLDDDASHEDVVIALHHLLAKSPAHLVAATLEDMGLVVERPNMPGTIDTWPNWSWGLPVPLEELLATTLATEVRQALAARVGAPA